MITDVRADAHAFYDDEEHAVCVFFNLEGEAELKISKLGPHPNVHVEKLVEQIAKKMEGTFYVKLRDEIRKALKNAG